MKRVLFQAIACAAIAAAALEAARGPAQGQAVLVEMRPDHRSHMGKAIDALKAARSELQAAAREHDYGGHRLGALSNVEEALIQANAAVQDAKANDKNRKKR